MKQKIPIDKRSPPENEEMQKRVENRENARDL
jgi:antitoxin component of RelBE/YafQ-DinJ toxin-antitoxin module